MSNDVLWLMQHNFRPASVQKTVDRYSRQVLYERMFGGNAVRNAMTLFHTANKEPFRQRVRDFLRTAEESQ